MIGRIDEVQNYHSNSYIRQRFEFLLCETWFYMQREKTDALYLAVSF